MNPHMMLLANPVSAAVSTPLFTLADQFTYPLIRAHYVRNTGAGKAQTVPDARIHPISLEMGWMNTGSISGTVAEYGQNTGGIRAEVNSQTANPDCAMCHPHQCPTPDCPHALPRPRLRPSPADTARPDDADEMAEGVCG